LRDHAPGQKRPGESVCLSSGEVNQALQGADRGQNAGEGPVRTEVLIAQISPVIRGWGAYYCKAHVRKLFNQLDRWIVRRIWSHRHKRWRITGWKKLPESRLYGEMSLVKLIALIPSLASAH
jgi:hypothetical protein